MFCAWSRDEELRVKRPSCLYRIVASAPHHRSHHIAMTGSVLGAKFLHLVKCILFGSPLQLHGVIFWHNGIVVGSAMSCSLLSSPFLVDVSAKQNMVTMVLLLTFAIVQGQRFIIATPSLYPLLVHSAVQYPHLLSRVESGYIEFKSLSFWRTHPVLYYSDHPLMWMGTV